MAEEMSKEIIDRFKEMFKSMTPEQREEYLNRHGFVLVVPDDLQKK